MSATQLTEMKLKVPTYDDIQHRAYEIWQTRIRHGIVREAEKDWIEAEEELTEKRLNIAPKLPAA